MSILLWVLIILVGVPVLLAVTPVRYRVTASYDAGLKAKATVSYMLRLFHMTVVHEGKETQTVVRVAGINVSNRFKEKPVSEAAADGAKPQSLAEKEKQKKAKQKKVREPFKLNFDSIVSVLTHPDLKTIIGLIFELIKKMFKYMLPKKFDVTGVVGFSDPFNTGILIGAFDGFLHALNKHRHIMITGDFENTALKLEVKASGRLSAAGALAPLVWFITRRPIFKLIIAYIKAGRRSRTGGKNGAAASL